MIEKNTLARMETNRRTITGLLVVVAVGIAVLLMVLFALPQSASAAGPTREFAVSTTSPDQLSPAIEGDLVVWEDKRDGLSNIYGRRLPDGLEFLISSGPNVKKRPVTDGEFVVWEDHRSGDADIYGYNLSTRTEFPIASGPGDQRKPAISGDTVVWEDNRSGNWEIYHYDLSSKQEFRLTAGSGNKTNPSVSGNTVVWQDDGGIVGNSDIYARDLSTGEVFPVSSGDAYKDMPAISGGIVVWRQESVANYDIFGRDLYAKDLSTGEVFQITTDARDQVAPAISGHLVVWEDHRDGNADVYGKDLATGEIFQIATGAVPQQTPQVSGETVVWENRRISGTDYGTYDVFGASLDTAPAAPENLRATGSLEGIALSWSASTEGDLAGYNVYRSDSPEGPYAKLNLEGLLAAGAPSFTDPGAPRGAVSYYRVTAVDAAGNESAPARVVSAAHARTGITLNARASVLKYGKTTLLSGKLTSGGSALSGKRVVLERKLAGARRFTLVRGGRLTTDGTGSFSRKVSPRKNTVYRVRFVGALQEGLRPSVSRNELVRVRPRVSLAGPKRSGSYLNIAGRVTEVRRGKVKLAIRRNGKLIARRSVRLNDSRYWFAYRLPGAGRYAMRASLATSRSHLGSSSPIKTFRTLR